MSVPKSTPRLPDFGIDDITRRFAVWLQRRRREEPDFDEGIAVVTGASLGTIKQWRHGQRPGVEAMLLALAYGGPRAVNEVLLDPMGMTGARFVDDDPVIDHLFVALREFDAAIDGMKFHPNNDVCDIALDRALDVLHRLGQMLRLVVDLQRARHGGRVVDMRERDKRA